MSTFKLQRTARLLSPTLRSIARVQVIPRRFASSKDSAERSSEQNQDARLVRQPEPQQALIDHELDYDAHIDHGTS